MSKCTTLYKLLGLEVSNKREVNMEDLNKNYRNIQRLVHPDKRGEALSRIISSCVNQARDLLSQANHRLAYAIRGRRAFEHANFVINWSEMEEAAAYIERHFTKRRTSATGKHTPPPSASSPSSSNTTTTGADSASSSSTNSTNPASDTNHSPSSSNSFGHGSGSGGGKSTAEANHEQEPNSKSNSRGFFYNNSANQPAAASDGSAGESASAQPGQGSYKIKIANIDTHLTRRNQLKFRVLWKGLDGYEWEDADWMVQNFAEDLISYLISIQRHKPKSFKPLIANNPKLNNLLIQHLIKKE